MKRRDLVIGALVIVAVVLLLRSRLPDNTPQITDEAPLSDLDRTQEELEGVLGRQIPDDAERTTLTDLTGSGIRALATRAESEGVVEFTLLADLEEPESGAYQVWAGETTESLLPLGTMIPAKGGYILEYRKSGNLTDYNLVSVLHGEQEILQGGF